MFLIRQAKPQDVPTLLKLARMVYFLNLPPEERLLATKVAQSQASFKRLAGVVEPNSNGSRRHASTGTDGLSSLDEEGDFFLFSMEEVSSGGVIGTSQLRAHQGGPGNPNWSLRIGEKRFHSASLGFGTSHTVVQLHADESGPTEIGGIILQPSHRGHPVRPGRLLSFVRFHLIGLHRHLFAERILAEMMGPVTSEGESAFWDAFGRKFIPVKFPEADRFCQHNRRFISELLPKEEIYLTLMPLEILNSVGVVSRETIPARRMLENMGFRYRGYVDPFDGGPHLDALTDDLPIIRATRTATAGRTIATDSCSHSGIVSTLDDMGEFRAIETRFELTPKNIRLPAESAEILGITSGMSVGVTPMNAPKKASPAKRAAKPKAAARRRSKA
ncbi:MAG: arginine N-succinyltransferase [Phycisphaerales bacterium]|nr:arginine N-succinyltransferase [Phycisphaerales bacterium]